ncbi:hypothetical protein [Nonomuraea soli]|uniref:Uncharacterized protein n=1 Tax=Nonomuraea soli TaxID=1032476 RepID=A0A7W0CUQ7_9ACTN|nr:hypothetical protein [Nonomuraea soli]MBA2897706.1 hypothetical protein [Nonomuraea soli]
MNFQQSAQRYAELLLGEGSWLSEELAWTVLRPLGEPLTLSDVAQRLVGDGAAVIIERDFEEACGANAVVIEETDEGVMIVDLYRTSNTPDPDFIARLSRNVDVWHVSWHTALSRRMIHALDGRILAVVPYLDPAYAIGEDLNSVEVELRTLSAAQHDPWPAVEATALAIIEGRTGARLHLDWFDHVHPSVAVEGS